MTESLSRPASASDERLVLTAGLGPWRCRRLQLSEAGDELNASFERSASTDWIEVSVFLPSAGRRVFKQFEHCAVGYRGAVRERTPELRAQIAALVLAVGESIDQRLAARPGASIAEALGRRGQPARLIFGRDALLELLSPDIALGRELASGFRLADVYPSSHLHEADSDDLVLVLDFRRERDGRRVLYEVRRRRDDRPALSSTQHFTLTQLSLGVEAANGLDELSTLVSFVLSLRDHPLLDVEFPDVLSELSRALPAPAPPDGDDRRVLNLAINTACGQACSFCSVQDLAPPVAGDARLEARLRADLESNRARGVRAVRINGYDPLSYPRILELLELVRDLGYERADVFSPCTRLAERAFCEAVLARLPARRCIHVPVYAADAAAHDRVVGRPGAFALVTQALSHLCELTGPGEVALLGVATRGALGELARAAAWARELGLPFSAHMPYPSSQSKIDRFFESVPRQTDVAEAMAASLERGVPLPVHGVAPCVTLACMLEKRIPLGRWLDAEGGSQPLPGTEYKLERFVHRAAEAEHSAFRAASVPCPHAGECALSPACSREHLVSYLAEYGAAEFSPVTIHALLAAASPGG